MVKTRISKKWFVFAALVVLGLLCLFVFSGYSFSGLCFLGIAALIPIYHCLDILKNHKPKLGRLGIMLLSIFLAVLAIAMTVTCGVIVHSSKGAEDPKADYLLVLGAGVNGTVPSRSLRERLDAALDYLEQYPEAQCIVSGGQGNGEDITEAECMYRYLVEAGISAQRIWQEDKATTTLENLEFTLDLIEEKTGSRPEKMAIVSSEYHLHRAGVIARWFDLEPLPVPAKTGIVPLRWNYFLREIFAVWYYTILGGN